MRAVLPGMFARGHEDITVTSSISGHQALHWEPVYSSTKHAVQSFVHGVRRHGVRVGEISRGVFVNKLWGYHDHASIDAKVATWEGIRSEDVADAVRFMLTRPPNVTIRDLVILSQNQHIWAVWLPQNEAKFMDEFDYGGRAVGCVPTLEYKARTTRGQGR
ncbi:SDR family oxidoreductase [Rhizobium tubonense]|uniref:SDR family oxidoreductase n=1 Tax=Rhizobium tubonense TaxID=484088 RepID=UPI0023BA0C47|nr:SDR family NAD(P)-dependent oxidoreductase [Rhizobium tubonense]